MGKKRKASGRPFGHNKPQELNDADSKLRINTYEDVADSEDEFHINRDKILLEEGPAQKRQRKLQEEGKIVEITLSTISYTDPELEAFLEPSDEEVLAISEHDSDYDDDFDNASESPETSTRQTKPVKFAKGVQRSDSEVSDAPEKDEDISGWGTSRRDYYNADTITTEADALEEEAEARRLQQKQLQDMIEADFGFDELEWLKASKSVEDGEDDDGDNVIREVLPKLQITDAMGPEERLRILRIRYPEFEPLAKEFIDLQAVHEDLKTVATAAIALQQQLDVGKDEPLAAERPTPIAVVKHAALSAYLAALSMYFALLTSGPADSEGKLSAMPSEELRDHTIMATLVQCRDLWERLKNVTVPKVDGENISEVEKPNGHATDLGNHELKDDKGKKSLKEGMGDPPKRKKKRKSKEQKAAEAAQAKADALRAERLRKTEEELASLSTLTAPSKLSSKAPKRSAKIAAKTEDSDSDFGEQTALTPHEAAEKAKRKKSLQFYTSQIAQKSNKRDAAGRDAGGDADLPYRERLKDRQARLNAEAEARGKKSRKTEGEALGGPSDEEDHAAAQELRDGSGSEDYYDLVTARSAETKASKAARAAAHAQAEKEGGIVRVVEEETADGKRAISYAIEKNKGLAPRRKKDVRNPRVKKRKKFEEKKKKLGSIRQIYKGGEGRGGYGGEKTGISTRLVKSVKL